MEKDEVAMKPSLLNRSSSTSMRKVWYLLKGHAAISIVVNKLPSIFLLRGHRAIALNALDTVDAVNFGLGCTDLAIGYLLLDPVHTVSPGNRMAARAQRKGKQAYEKPLMVAVYLWTTVQPFSSACLAALCISV